MTDDDIKQLHALTDAATPAPWRYDGIDIVQLTDAGKGYVLDTYPDSVDVAIGKCSGCGNTDVGIQRREDAAFIAAARGAVPVLIAEIARLRHLTRIPPSSLAVRDAPEFLEAVKLATGFLESVKIATAAENTQLRAALAEALDIFNATWCPEHGHAPKREQFDRIQELTKLVLP